MNGLNVSESNLSSDRPTFTVVVIGGGAAGFFGAITCATTYPQARVILLEAAAKPLAKVRISGDVASTAARNAYLG